ncbi:hypothetical protein T03_16491 [Trichinella britovi]|uniref:Uncharacterized protein n=1 Tax=Trichinella britovi TaxID=45882 RepID=A0A0V1B4K7_TRIBR|nr:hypothetical protein T03_16491 [Trichinella britovi]
MLYGKELPKSGGCYFVICFRQLVSLPSFYSTQLISKSDFYSGFDTTVAIAKSTE